MTYMRLTSRTLSDLSQMIEHLREQVSSLKLDMRHIQDQTTNYNTNLVNLTLKVDQIIEQKGDSDEE